jgi:predicted flap endonuclease-1-like 5' DNA nuclease
MHDDRQRLESQKRTPLAAPLLTDVMGIGKARAQELKRAGIKSVRDLAQADPSDVAGAVRGVSVTNAALLIQHARRLLAGRSQAIAD